MPNLLEILSTYTFGTPDFGHSDIWHFNFPLKFLLSQALKAGYLPLWSKDIGTGFPVLGEGQIGVFNLYNFLAFSFLNPVLAFNLGFLVIFVTSAAGTYLFCRSLKLSNLSSLFSALIFSLSGYFATQVVHFNLLQAASFLPWEFYLAEKIFQSKQLRWKFLFAFVLSQQIYAGFPQVVMISLVGVGLYALGKKNLKYLCSLGLTFVAGVILASPQLYANWQLSHFSFRTGSVAVTTLADFPFGFKNFISFVLPYFFGDPRVGTYPHYSSTWGIFWESTPYLGILPILLAATSYFHKKFTKITKILMLLLVISGILLLGRNTFLFFVSQIPPLSFFRVPARFLWIFVWSLTILATIGYERLAKWLKVIVLVTAVLDLANFAIHYNAIINTTSWLKTPETVEILSKDQSWYRIYTNVPYVEWNKLKGWGSMANYYAFRNALDPNQNLFWNIPNVDYYTGLAPRRLEVYKNLIDVGVNSATVSSSSAKLLSLAGVKYFITASPLSISGFEFFATTSGNPSFIIYSNLKAKPHAYLTTNFEVVQKLDQLQSKLLEPNNLNTIIEDDVPMNPSHEPVGTVDIIQNDDGQIKLNYSANRQSLLVLSDTYYPGWEAYIDTQKTKILPANLNQRALVVPPGTHQVIFIYRPLKIL